MQKFKDAKMQRKNYKNSFISDLTFSGNIKYLDEF